MKENNSPMLFLKDVWASVATPAGPAYEDSPLSENWEVVAMRLQSLILEKV